MVKEKSSRVAGQLYIFLEDAEFYDGDLIDIHTTKRREMIKKIRTNLSAHKPPKHLKKALLDVAIVLHVRKGRYRTQDLDNIAKIVVDALEKPTGPNDKLPYLYENDSQIIRLLLYKIQRKDQPDAETSQLSISVRKHNPHKEMVLRELKSV